MLVVGTGYRPDTERRSHDAEFALAGQYDAWAWFDRTGLVASSPAPSRPGLDETYRSGLPNRVNRMMPRMADAATKNRDEAPDKERRDASGAGGPEGSGESGQQRSPFEGVDLDAVMSELEADREGLSDDEARKRLERDGPNEIAETETNPLLKFLGAFWGPIPLMIEVAAALSAAIGHWVDLSVILVLLVVNAGVGFWEEHQAENAVAALKQTLASKARVRRGGQWREVPSREVVKGDILKLDIGTIVPADVKLIEGDHLSVDQSALTGESLPVDRAEGDVVYSGSHCEQGGMTGVAVATAMDTVFGRTARLVESAGSASEFQKAVGRIARYLIVLSLVLIALMVAVELLRGRPILDVVQFALILAVASIPVAMPAVLSVTMAVGALALAKRKAIVSRLDAIEEMAGIDVLCTDKTGTLTQNRLKLQKPVAFEGEAQDVVLAAALASPRDGGDAIDRAVAEGLDDTNAVGAYEQVHFAPFNYVNKRTEAESRKDGRSFRTAKGAPVNVMEFVSPSGEVKEKAEKAIGEMAEKGYRTLAVARDDGDGWKLLGLLPLEDPPRDDAKSTIEEAVRHGLAIKMLTGDDIAIARQTAKTLGLDGDILEAGVLGTGTEAEAREREGQERERGLSPENLKRVKEAAGFAEVFPEHKFDIVRGLQDAGHLVGMTGDGVNDAPALKQANVGIAVKGATETARAAAALVLTEAGLGTVIAAIEEARRIFARMNAYAIYRVAETIRIMLFVVATVLAFGFYPLTAILVILLALLNDLPIMTIAYDNTRLSDRPVRWDMRRVLTVSSVLGVVGVLSTFGMLVTGKLWLRMGDAEVQSLIFVKLVFAGHLTLFVTRTRGRLWTRPYPSPILLGAVVATQVVAALIVGLGVFVARLPWLDLLWVYAYAILWALIGDQAKLLAYRFVGAAHPDAAD